MTNHHALILGGVRSGKSRFAEQRALESGLAVRYLATATAGDAAMAARIAAHQARRPATWQVIEEPIHLAAALTAATSPQHCVLVECLTLWLTNLLCAGDETQLQRELTALHDRLPHLPGQVIFVTNETNLGIIPADALSRRYGDLAGELHQALAAHCGQVWLCVAGLPVILKGNRG
ncbi:bifunctional adenosylcobinamide kinase/adenosylcobinamide-phosphate guanylyltransferase [Thiospirillum jenense]|uniref:Bifunctional adenosylcobalamin biosynthesis protein n=1 Tax=Thiospirillum jenense TaxID=1653858 RepID=A0A839H6Q5_9GAMM|nr:bifunctional adenosylcobinamide kinase/adenosylcobinamide-phosphate guanylyltransferase [Thiospirillum jenense]